MNHRVLIIDDNRAIHEDFRRILCPQMRARDTLEQVEAELFGNVSTGRSKSMFDVDSAYQGEEGLDCVKQALVEARPYCVAFVDVRMPPGWDGVETIQRIWEEYPDLQVVICTAYTDFSWEEMSERLGVGDKLLFLKKPFDVIEVQQLANTLSEKWRLFQGTKQRSIELENIVSQRTAELRREIHDRKEAEEAARSLQALYASLVENLPQNILRKDRQGRFTFANGRFCQSLGKTMEQILGKTDADFFPPDLAAKYQEDDRGVVASGQPFETVEQHPNPDGGYGYVQALKTPLRNPEGEIVGLQCIFWDVTPLRRAEEELRKLVRAVEQSPASIVITDLTGRIEYVNPKFCAVTGYTPAEVLGQNPRVLKSGEMPAEAYRRLWERLTNGQEWRGEFHNRKKNGELYWEFAVLSPIKDEDGQITHFLAVKEDITERKRTERERDLMELQLRQAQKLESIGQLAAGIAHEINTPMQYIGDNTRFLQDSFTELRGIIDVVQGLRTSPEPRLDPSQILPSLEAAWKAADVDYLLEEIPKALAQTLQGADRVARIVRAMKEFSHPGTEQKTKLDLNHAIESTLTVARNEYKYVAELTTDLDPHLPLVDCLPGEFNQVILNLVINAAHAIGDLVGVNSGQKGLIAISTRRQAEWVEICVSDTGCGIPESVRSRIFDPFFTTKPMGKGSGQGLAIARSVVVDKHGGTIHFETEVGRGARFIVRLPLDSERSETPCGMVSGAMGFTAASDASGKLT
jgi:two-component system, NtrC family, sensor kinase